MLIDVGYENGQRKYENLVEDADFVDIIATKISPEFAYEVGDRLNDLARQRDLDLQDADYIMMENEQLCNVIDEVNSLLQHLVVPLEKGERINREKVIKTLKQAIKMLEEYR